MRFLFLLIVLTSTLPTRARAQSAELRTIEWGHLLLPTDTLAGQHLTYSLEVDDPTDVLGEAGIKSTHIFKSWRLRDYRRVDTLGDLRVRLRVDAYRLWGASLLTDTTKVFNRRDSTTSTYVTYRKQLSYTLPISITVAGPHGVLYEEQANRDPKYRSWPTQSSSKSVFNSQGSLNSRWQKNKAAVLNDFKRLDLTEYATQAAKDFRKNFDRRATTTPLKLAIPNGRKVDSDLATRWTAVVARLSENLPDLGSAPGPATAHAATDAAQVFFKQQTARLSPEDKKQRRLYTMAAYNLAVVELVRENFAAARRYAGAALRRDRWAKEQLAALDKLIVAAEQNVADSPFSTRYAPPKGILN